MKYLTISLLSLSFLCMGALVAEEAANVTARACACKDCKCTVNSHCGCRSGQGCTCGLSSHEGE